MLNQIQLVILLVATGLPQGYTGKGTLTETTCSVSKKGTSGRITCHFSANLNVTKQDFSVRCSHLDGSHAESIVDCMWVSSDRPLCFIDTLYKFNGVVSEMAVIQIPKLKEENDTQYWCQTIPSELSHVEPCSFKPPVTAHIKTDTNRTCTIFYAIPTALLLGSLLLSLLLL